MVPAPSQVGDDLAGHLYGTPFRRGFPPLSLYAPMSLALIIFATAGAGAGGSGHAIYMIIRH